MKKVLTLLLAFLTFFLCYSQQFEWYKTFKFSYPPNSNFGPDSKICDLGENIALISSTCGKNVVFEETEEEILAGNSNNSEPYIIIFNKKGEILKSFILYTKNGSSSVSDIFYNKNNGMTYCIYSSTGDSISFDSSKTWSKINKSKNQTKNIVIAIFDYKFDMVYNMSFSASKSNIIMGDIYFDKLNNLYCLGYFKDSLLFNNSLILIARTKYDNRFLLKINTSNEIEWVNNLGIMLGIASDLNETRNSIYVTLEGAGIDNYIIYNKNTDSLNIPATSSPQTTLFAFDTENGLVKDYVNITYPGNEGMGVNQIISNKNNIIISFKLWGKGEKKLIINGDTSKYNLSNGENFIICFDASNLNKKFINFFDYTKNNVSNNGNYLILTNIYNDSLYSVFGTVGGNFNFSFNGQSNYSEDFLKTRSSGKASNYFATYTTSNNLKDIWFLTEHPYVEYSSFFGNNSPYIFEKDGDIYISGNIKYYASLGLGKREFIYSTYIDKSLTLIKYNCKPTAYFKYKTENDSILFKNVSSGFCNYKWDFGDGTTTSQKSPYHKFKSNTASYKVTLITTNSCGSDTFYRYYSTAGVAALKNNNSIKVYPNPLTCRAFSINTNENDEIQSVKIYNTAGLQVDECDFQQNSKSNYYATLTSNIAKGIYFIHVLLSNNTAYVSKLLVD